MSDTILEGDHPRIISVKFGWYWKQLWSRWAITGSWEPLVYICRHFCGNGRKGFFFFIVIKNLVVIVQANLSFFFIIVTVIWTMTIKLISLLLNFTLNATTFCLILYLHPCPFILNYICEDFFFNYLSWQFWWSRQTLSLVSQRVLTLKLVIILCMSRNSKLKLLFLSVMS